MNVIQLENHDLAMLIDLIRYTQLVGVNPAYWLLLEARILKQVHQQRTGFYQCALCLECHEPMTPDNGQLTLKKSV